MKEKEALPSGVIRTCEILCVGTELLLGDIVNTNAAFLSKRLAALGISVYHQAVVGDHADRLTSALADAFEGHGRPCADLVILSGGLGPTYDDMTKETVAKFFGRDMYTDEESLDRIRTYFERTGRVMTPNNAKQAQMPIGATVFQNDYGTAPALALSDGKRTAIMLPGPPAELEPIFDEQVLPYLRRYTDGVLISHNIHIMGLGESAVEAVLRDLMVNAKNPTVAPYCKAGEVRLRVTAKSESVDKADRMCAEMIERIRKTDVEKYIYGVDVDTPEAALFELMRTRGLTLATAESCTGGMLGERMTVMAGVSAVYLGGVVTYTNEQKINLLGVKRDTIDKHTEVSEQCAAEMAEGACRLLGADVAISTTGYAGPGGGTEENPVGTVYVSVATERGTRTERLSYSGRKSRDYIRTAAASRAFLLAVKAIME
ncbi:MAG: competence/damage-inducible protein A [Clostridia bacterium]|nr:competence/damage-inducible protein A [Clostridia bacterium]